MFIDSCYIEGFGKITNKKFDFSKGLNKIIGENGSGKTTLSVFIKVMLYGMSDTKKTGLDENDRKHYLPWGGGVCGGSLDFTVGRMRYRVERSFAPKAADDRFALYDLSTGKISGDYTENLGKELFGIDIPVTKTGIVIISYSEPSIVQYKKLNIECRCLVSKRQNRFIREVKI